MTRCQKLISPQIKELVSFINDNENSSREIKRAQAVIMVDKLKPFTEISEMTGLARSQVFELRKQYLKNGITALKDKREKKLKELLTKQQKQEVITILKTKTPKDCGYSNDYWSTGLLGHLIKRSYRVNYKSKTSYYLIFRQAKFTYHKPGRVYRVRDEAEVKEWQEKVRPVIAKTFKDPNTVILTEDEMLLSTQSTVQKIWLPQGEYPKVEINIKKENRSLYGFLNIKTGQEHTFKTKWQNMYLTTEILTKIRNIYPKKKLLILWDGAGWHRGSKVQEFIKQDKNIQTIYFPRYAPEQNPQEHVWKSGRNKVTHNRFIQDIDQATDELIRYFRSHKFNYSLLSFKSDFGM